MNLHPSSRMPLSVEQIEKAGALWLAHRDTERIAIHFGRHESVVYNQIDTIKQAAREIRINAWLVASA